MIINLFISLSQETKQAYFPKCQTLSLINVIYYKFIIINWWITLHNYVKKVFLPHFKEDYMTISVFFAFYLLCPRLNLVAGLQKRATHLTHFRYISHSFQSLFHRSSVGQLGYRYQGSRYRLYTHMS